MVSVYLRVLEDPTGVLWHNFVKWANPYRLSRGLMCFIQLRFEEGNGIRRTEKPGCYGLYEHHSTVPLLYQLLPKGTVSRFSLTSTVCEPQPRPFTKSRRKASVQQKASHWHSNGCFTTCEPPISPLVRTTLGRSR